MNFAYIAIVAGIMFAVANYFLKISGDLGFTDRQAMLLVGIGYFISALIVLVVSESKLPVISSKIAIPVASGLFTLMGTLALFSSLILAKERFGTAMGCLQISIVMMAVVIGLFAGEKISLLKGFAICLGLVAILIMSST